MSPLPPSLEGLPTGKPLVSGGAVTPAAAGPPTAAGGQWLSRPLLFRTTSLPFWLFGREIGNRLRNDNRSASLMIGRTR